MACRQLLRVRAPVDLIHAAAQLNDEGPADDDEGEDGVPSYREWALPAREFEGLWDR
jgi:hypothetical protein